MLKGEYIYLRLFEPEDYQKTYQWHNDVELQKTTCGPIRIVSREIERNWVLSKSTNNNSELYLAICLNSTDEMIGWYSVTGIDHLNRKCHCSGVIIGDKKYRDGSAFQEAGWLATLFVFNELNMNRVSGTCLREHLLSRACMENGFWSLEGIERNTIYKNGVYHDICHYALFRDVFFDHLKNGDFDERASTRRLKVFIDKIKNDIKNNQ